MTNSQMLGYVATDRERLACALLPLNSQLATPSGAGYGVAHYTDESVLLNRRPGVELDGHSFVDMLGGVRTRLLIAHAAGDDGQRLAARDLQPFKYRQWAFAITGASLLPDARHDAVRASLMEGLPDFLSRDVKGYSCAEALFYRLLWRLHEASQLKRGESAQLVADPLLRVIDEVQSLAARHQAPGYEAMDLLLTDGQRIYVVAQDDSIAFRRIDGITDCELCYGREGDDGVSFSVRDAHQRFRAVVLLTGMKQPQQDWKRVEAGSVLVVDRALEIAAL